MATVYSTRFLAVHTSGDAFYEVPAGQVAVIRSVVVFNSSAAAAGWSLRIGTPPVYLLGSVLGPIGSTQSDAYARSYDVRVVLRSTERVYASPAAGVHMTVSGYLFSG